MRVLIPDYEYMANGCLRNGKDGVRLVLLFSYVLVQPHLSSSSPQSSLLFLDVG